MGANMLGLKPMAETFVTWSIAADAISSVTGLELGLALLMMVAMVMVYR